MREYTLRVGGLLSAILLFTFFTPTNAIAAEQLPTGAFIVRPAKVELNVSPGESASSVLTLSNGTALPLSVHVSFEDVAPTIQTSSNDEPVKLLGSDAGAYPLKDLIKTPKDSFDILSGKEVQLPITVTMPRNVEPGGRYGSVVVTFKPILAGSEKTDANIAIESRLATLFYVRIKGETKEEGHLVAFGLFNNAKTSKVPSETAPLKFQVAYQNTGAVHVNPYGRMTLTPIIGTAKIYTIDPLAVLPGETRFREVAVRESLPIGYYKAHLELNRGYSDIIDESEVSFWVLPGAYGWTLIVGGIIFLAWLIRRSLALSKHFVS